MKLPAVSEELVSRFINDPDNARKELDLESLLPSIRRDGILQPVGAVLDGESFRLVWGHRRLGCARFLDLQTIPARVFQGPVASGDVRRLALVENVQRLDLRPSEEYAAYKAYMEAEHLSARELAELLGVSESKVSKKLSLGGLVGELLTLVDQGLVPQTSAADLGKLDAVGQRQLAEAITEPISREQLAQAIGKPGKKPGRKSERTYRLTRGGLSLVCRDDDLDALLAEIEELKKAIRKGIEQGLDFATLARVLRVSATA